MNGPLGDGVHPDIPDAVYHGNKDALSPSTARWLLPPSCPAKFKERIANPPKPTPAFDFGHLVHTNLLGKGADIVVIDAADYRTKEAKAQRDQAHIERKTPVLVAEHTRGAEMTKVLYEHPLAHDLFLKGDAETTLYATDPDTGVRLRGRIDWMTQHAGRLTLVDFKTAADANPKTFARKAYDYSYHLQFAWYITLCQLLGLDDAPVFLFVVQEKEPPYPVSVVELDGDAFTLGRRHMQQAIAVYAECTESGVWPGYGDQIHSVSLPPWAFQTSEPTIGDLLELQP